MADVAVYGSFLGGLEVEQPAFGVVSEELGYVPVAVCELPQLFAVEVVLVEVPVSAPSAGEDDEVVEQGDFGNGVIVVPVVGLFAYDLPAVSGLWVCEVYAQVVLFAVERDDGELVGLCGVLDTGYVAVVFERQLYGACGAVGELVGAYGYFGVLASGAGVFVAEFSGVEGVLGVLRAVSFVECELVLGYFGFVEAYVG